jgi:hypothetical protein
LQNSSVVPGTSFFGDNALFVASGEDCLMLGSIFTSVSGADFTDSVSVAS